MPQIKVFHAGDILHMKKPHACSKSAAAFLVLYVGSDVKVKCLSCGREMLLARVKLEKSIRKPKCLKICAKRKNTMKRLLNS